LFLADSAWTGLEYPPADRIHSWSDLREIFVGNFQGTYECPENPWGLKNCRQKQGATLCEYVRRFSKGCSVLPNVYDADVIGAFLTSYESLVHKLGRKSPQTTKALLDIVMNHTSGEEAIGAIFNRAKGMEKCNKSPGEGGLNRPRKKKKNKRNYGGSLVAAADRKGGRAAAGETLDHFKKMLQKPCPNHTFPVNHLDCTLINKYLSGGTGKGEQKNRPEPAEGDVEGKDDGFPDPDGYLMIFGGPAVAEPTRITPAQVHEPTPEGSNMLQTV
jgi:hypothetical protein